MRYVCELCGTTYDEALGDPQHGIAAGTAFVDLPEDYECPGCGFQKEAFNKVVSKSAAEKAMNSRICENDTKQTEHTSSDR